MKRKKLILVSLDALSGTDFPYVKTLPHFSKIIEEGAYCTREASVYPSLTFPSHASIITGCVPASHGIVNNYIFAPFEPIPKWNFYASNLRRRAIWDYAAENGKEVLSISWPVSAGGGMKYSMPEMSPAKPKIWNAANFFRQIYVLGRYGTPSFGIKTLLSERGLPSAWFLGKQPHLDFSMMRSFLKAIEDSRFDIALLHIYGLDDAKHSKGTRDPLVKKYLQAYDKFVGQLMEYQERRRDENITLVFTGDHSQKDVKLAIYGNRLLERLGYAEYKNGKLVSYKAYLDSCDGMAYIYIKDKNPGKIKEHLKHALKGLPGIQAVMEPEQFKPLGCDYKADLVLEAEDGYSFESGYDEKAFSTEDGIVKNHYKALHGYLPSKPDYQTMFFCYGPDVAAKRLDEMCITDILPTVSWWLGMKTDPVDGICRKEVWSL